MATGREPESFPASSLTGLESKTSQASTPTSAHQLPADPSTSRALSVRSRQFHGETRDLGSRHLISASRHFRSSIFESSRSFVSINDFRHPRVSANTCLFWYSGNIRVGACQFTLSFILSLLLKLKIFKLFSLVFVIINAKTFQHEISPI
ncbi:uncharacterized protein LOC126587454 [Malus sylvestris]|uniref:uncharacterized protein LOC126587454 n=1 Tax=Malus sylvestris TaxID=3752 RepID=UPI0021AC05B1|nr:uncharacterized protein LOC126587454 [Malus sylvestris]